MQEQDSLDSLLRCLLGVETDEFPPDRSVPAADAPETQVAPGEVEPLPQRIQVFAAAQEDS